MNNHWMSLSASFHHGIQWEVDRSVVDGNNDDNVDIDDDDDDDDNDDIDDGDDDDDVWRKSVSK